MPRPRLRTRSRRRRRLSTPSGRSRVSYRKKKIGTQRCASCGRSFSLLPRSDTRIRRLSKSQKRVSRTYGGHLCHLCLRNLLKRTARTLPQSE